MNTLEEIYETAHADFVARSKVRDEALSLSRSLIRFASRAIRAVHRNEKDVALEKIAETADLAAQLNANLHEYPEIYFAGYTQDALKEYAEASIVFTLVYGGDFPTPEGLKIPANTSGVERGHNTAEVANDLYLQRGLVHFSSFSFFIYS